MMDDISKRKEQFSSYFHSSMQYGLYMGLFFSFIFFCSIGMFRTKMMIFQFIIFVSSVSVPFLLYFFLKKVRETVLNGVITFSMAWNLGTLICFFGGLILAIAMYITLEYITPDLFSIVTSTFNETVANLAEDTAGVISQEQIDLLQKLSKEIENAPVPSAIDIAIQNLWYCVSFGIFISIPIALVVRKKPNTDNQTTNHVS